MSNRRGGMISVTVNGVLIEVVGDWEIQLGIEKREAIVGGGGTHGYKGTPQATRISGRATWNPSLDLDAVMSMDDGTVVAVHPNGKVLTLRNAWYAGEGKLSTEDGSVEMAFEGMGYTLD